MIKAEWTNKDSLDLQPTCNQLAINNCVFQQAAIDALCREYTNDYQRHIEDLEYCMRYEPTFNPEDGSI